MEMKGGWTLEELYLCMVLQKGKEKGWIGKNHTGRSQEDERNCVKEGDKADTSKQVKTGHNFLNSVIISRAIEQQCVKQVKDLYSQSVMEGDKYAKKVWKLDSISWRTSNQVNHTLLST